jgi:hypothetical protein
VVDGVLLWWMASDDFVAANWARIASRNRHLRLVEW